MGRRGRVPGRSSRRARCGPAVRGSGRGRCRRGGRRAGRSRRGRRSRRGGPRRRPGGRWRRGVPWPGPGGCPADSPWGCNGAASYGGAQFGGGHAVPGGVLGDGERLVRVAGQRLEHRVAVGADVGAGSAQGDQEFMDGGPGLHLQEGVAAPGGPHDAPDGRAGGGGVGERDEGAVGLDVAELGVRGGGGAGEVDEALVPAGAGVGAVVVGVPGVSQMRLGPVTGVRRPSGPLNQPVPELTITATWWSRVRGPTVGSAPCWRPTPRQTRPRRWWSGLGVKKRIQV